ncbi:MAG: glycosyltransferase family 2 protein [Clostridia bacterium]|nr:glycosyltransferase family 2 protein [Clostridia bacterium]
MKEKIVKKGGLNEDCLISIIIPLYNNERFIGKCLESLLSQTHANLEVIVVDDASTDRSLFVALEYAKNDARIKVLQGKKYDGVSAVRNAGIKIAQGEYLCFVDSDDYVSKYYLESLLTALKDTGADVSCVGFSNVNEKQKKSLCKKFDKNKYGVEVFDKVNAMELLFSGRKIRMNIWNKMYHKSLFLGEDKILYDEKIYHGEDVSFLYDVFIRAEKVAFVPIKGYAYTKRKGSLVHSKINYRKLTYLSAVKYSAEKCKVQLPEAYDHVAGWRVGVNMEVLYYMWRDGFFDYQVFMDIDQTFKRDWKCFRRGKKQYLYRRLFAHLGTKILSALYRRKFKRQIKEKQMKNND